MGILRFILSLFTGLRCHTCEEVRRHDPRGECPDCWEARIW